MARRPRYSPRGSSPNFAATMFLLVLASAHGNSLLAITYSVSPNAAIPDNNASGVSSTINVPDSFTITLNVSCING